MDTAAMAGDAAKPGGSDPELTGAGRSIAINSWYRATSIALGLAGLGSGAAAVFITKVEAGPVALLVVGLILLLIGMGGRLPRRLKFGEHEAEWEEEEKRAGEKLAEVVENSPPDNRLALVSSLSELAQDRPRFATAAISAIAYETLINQMLIDITTSDERLRVSRTNDGGRDYGFDALITGPNGRTLVVEIKMGRNIGRGVVERISEQVKAYFPSHDIRILVVLAQMPDAPSGIMEFLRHPEMSFVVVPDTSAQPELHKAILKALGYESQ